MHHPELPDDDATPMPCVGGLVAGTLALMTTWIAADGGTAVDPAHQRDLIARKIVSNLFYLQHHPDLAPPLRQVMRNVHARWVSMPQASTSPAAAAADAPHVSTRVH